MATSKGDIREMKKLSKNYTVSDFVKDLDEEDKKIHDYFKVSFNRIAEQVNEIRIEQEKKPPRNFTTPRWYEFLHNWTACLFIECFIRIRNKK